MSNQKKTNTHKWSLEEDSSCVSVDNAKKRKDLQIANKAKKNAEIKSVNSVAEEIFDRASKSTSVSSYVQLEQELESAQRELRCTNLK